MLVQGHLCASDTSLKSTLKPPISVQLQYVDKNSIIIGKFKLRLLKWLGREMVSFLKNGKKLFFLCVGGNIYNRWEACEG